METRQKPKGPNLQKPARHRLRGLEGGQRLRLPRSCHFRSNLSNSREPSRGCTYSCLKKPFRSQGQVVVATNCQPNTGPKRVLAFRAVLADGSAAVSGERAQGASHDSGSSPQERSGVPDPKQPATSSQHVCPAECVCVAYDKQSAPRLMQILSLCRYVRVYASDGRMVAVCSTISPRHTPKQTVTPVCLTSRMFLQPSPDLKQSK